DALNLDQAVDDNHANTGCHGPVDLGDRLVVAVQADHARVDAGGQGDGQLSPAGDIEEQAGLGHPAGDLRRQERLACVVDVGGAADAGELAVEGGAGRECPGTRIRFINHVKGRSELFGQFDRGDARDLDDSVPIAGG